MATDEKKRDAPSGEKTVDVHYKKTESYRSYHVDGLFGGLTPNGQLYIELFLERLVTPQTIRYTIASDGSLGDEKIGDRIGKSGIVREIEAGLIMHISTAKIIKSWLDEKIKEHDAIMNKIGTMGGIH